MKRKVVAQVILFFTLTISTTTFAKEGRVPRETSLPLKFNTGNPAPYGAPSTVISIENKSIPVLFDTGASKSELVLSAHALKGLHVKFTDHLVCFKALDGKHCQKEFIIPEVKIGTFILKNIKGTLMSKLWGGKDEGFIPTEASRNGVIGYDLLSRFNFLLDYAHARVVLYRRGEQPAQYDFSQWTAVPFHGQLRTTLVINGKTMTLSWDTGAVPSIINASLVKNMHAVKCPVNTPFGKNTHCQQITAETFTTTKGGNLSKTWFVTENFPAFVPFDGLVGSNFYMQNLVYVDSDNHKIYVSRDALRRQSKLNQK